MIAELHSSKDPRFEALLALFHQEFTPETREPDEQLIAEVDGQWPLPYRYFVWADPDVEGFIRFVHLPQTEALFVIHVAVAPASRGKGIGSQLLAAVRATAPGLPIVCEVDPEEAMDWWRGRGARTVTPSYTQPALRPETKPVPFHLMAIGEPKPTLVADFYREVWELEPDHPFVQRAQRGGGK